MCNATCRTCSRKSNHFIDIFSEDSPLMYKQFCSLTKIQISPNDGLPNTICLKCNKKMKVCIEFLTLCLKSDAFLRSSQNENYVSEDGEYNDRTDNIVEVKQECNTITSKNNENINLGTNQTGKKFTKLQCSTCGKVMSSSFRLKTHLATHSQEKAFSCQFCEKRFSIQQNLKVHLRTHMGQKPHKCSICGKTFAQSSGLAVHKRKHSGSLPYKCNICRRSFRTIGHLTYHVRTHTGEKSYECSTCGRSFITKSDLKVHLMTHTGDKPHICSVCGMQFSRAANLRRHIKHTHKSESYPCIQCKSEFTSKQGLDKHVCDIISKL